MSPIDDDYPRYSQSARRPDYDAYGQDDFGDDGVSKRPKNPSILSLDELQIVKRALGSRIPVGGRVSVGVEVLNDAMGASLGRTDWSISVAEWRQNLGSIASYEHPSSPMVTIYVPALDREIAERSAAEKQARTRQLPKEVAFALLEHRDRTIGQEGVARGYRLFREAVLEALTKDAGGNWQEMLEGHYRKDPTHGPDNRPTYEVDTTFLTECKGRYRPPREGGGGSRSYGDRRY